MAGIMDYLNWRGDLLFSQDPPNAVDALVFSTLIYVRFDGAAKNKPEKPIVFRDAAEAILALDDCEKHGRNRKDIDLLRAASNTQRYGASRLVKYQEMFIPEQDTQFAAGTFLLDDGSAVIAFRGTDNTLTGWKEDFNMSFQDTVPAQRLAVQYAAEVHAAYDVPLRFCGHSKGGNLAIFAASQSAPEVRNKILDVYNNDGPGFMEYMLGDPGYLAMVPRIHTYVPQSSVIGMLMDRKEETTIIKSTQLGLLQHDTFTWEVIGKSFVPMDKITADSDFVNRTLRNWLESMTIEERNAMVDRLFGLLEMGELNEVSDIFLPSNIRLYLRTIKADQKKKEEFLSEIRGLMEAARKTRAELNGSTAASSGNQKEKR